MSGQKGPGHCVVIGKIARVIRCLRVLEAGWHTTVSLSLELDTTTRTVQRYLLDLQEAGVPLQSRRIIDEGYTQRGSARVQYHAPRWKP